MEITVDEDVKKMIMEEKRDYRVCTVKEPKQSDLKYQIGDNFLYISRIQAMYISRVTMDMIYEDEDIDACPAFYYK